MGSMLFPVTQDVVDREAERMNDAGIAYTPRHLYYAVCAAVESPSASVASAQIGSGALLLLVAVLLPWKAWQIGLAVAGILIVGLGAYNKLKEASRPKGRALALSYQDFLATYCAKDAATDAVHPLDAGSWTPPEERECSDLIVCDLEETAAFLAANATHLAGSPVTDEAHAWKAPRLLALHDADIGGSLMASRLHVLFPDAVIVDVALRPSDSLDLYLPVFEGAPRTLPPESFDALSMEEQLWLHAGKRCELASVPFKVLAARCGTARSLETPGITALPPLNRDVGF